MVFVRLSRLCKPGKTGYTAAPALRRELLWLSPAWATGWIFDRSELQSETFSQKEKKKFGSDNTGLRNPSTYETETESGIKISWLHDEFKAQWNPVASERTCVGLRKVRVFYIYSRDQCFKSCPRSFCAFTRPDKSYFSIQINNTVIPSSSF